VAGTVVLIGPGFFTAGKAATLVATGSDDKLEIIVQEILQDKIFLDMSNELKSIGESGPTTAAAGPPTFDFAPKPHWEIGASLGMIDLERAGKVSGSGFVFYRGVGARLIRSLIAMFMDTHRGEHGYEEVWPPLLVNRATMTGTGQLPKFEDDAYGTRGDDLFLIPTAEVPVTNLYRDEIIEADAMPMAFVAYSKCFRREAGSAGKDTRGILRTHEFDKVELVRYVARDVGRAARAAHAPRRDDAGASGAALSTQAARRRRHRV
jgi:seryl-tRNA synthetase